MARISKALATLRENDVLEAFGSNPSLTAFAVNDALHTKYGFKMNLKRIYELKKQAVAEKQEFVTPVGN